MATMMTLTRDTLLTAAIRTLGVLAAGQSPSTEDLSIAATKLNLLIAKMRTKGLFLWKRNTVSVALTANTSSYEIGEGKTLNYAMPLKMLEAYSYYTGSVQRIPVDIISNMEYNVLPTTATGTIPYRLSYQPLKTYGVVKIWPTPSTTGGTMELVYHAPFEYPASGTSSLDFPDEWYLSLVYELAVLLAPDWGIPLEDRKELKAEAKTYTDAADSFGEEDASMFIIPSR